MNEFNFLLATTSISFCHSTRISLILKAVFPSTSDKPIFLLPEKVCERKDGILINEVASRILYFLQYFCARTLNRNVEYLVLLKGLMVIMYLNIHKGIFFSRVKSKSHSLQHLIIILLIYNILQAGIANYPGKNYCRRNSFSKR